MTYVTESFADVEIVRLLGALVRPVLRRDTLVVPVSDHADLLGDHWMPTEGRSIATA